jgi:hypothetical protein
MEITEMLLTINENVDEVHEAGYSKGETAGFDAGKQAEYDAFWDAVQGYGNSTSYNTMFGSPWTKALLKPKYDINVSSAIYMFAFNTMGGDLVEHFDSLGRKLDFSRCINANATFQSSRFTRVGKIYCSTANWYNCFNACTQLITIDEWGNFDENGKIEGGLTSCFTGCSALENITVKGIISGSISFNSSTKLTRASIESIINHLTNAAIYGTLTLSKTAVETAFEVHPADYDGDGKIDAWIGSGEEEWIALISSKSNWDIVVV